MDWVKVSFAAYAVAYVPLIYLSNHAGVPPLAILPVSTFSCCIWAVIVTLALGWRKHLAPSPERIAGRRASPYTAAIMLLTPTAYAVAGALHTLATLTVMKVGSLMVALSRRAGVQRTTPRVLAAVLLCAMAILLAAYGPATWSWAAGHPWAGSTLSAVTAMIGAAYMVAYRKRLQWMGPHKHSMAFYVSEHLGAPFLAMGALTMAAGAGFWCRRLGYRVDLLEQVIQGFGLWRHWDLWTLGFCSQVVGLAGGWILVGRTLSSAAMVINRCAALLAGSVLVALQGFHFTLADCGALVVPFALLLLGNRKEAH